MADRFRKTTTFNMMTAIKKNAFPENPKPEKHYKVYVWIIGIGVILMLLVWWYFENK